MSHNLMVNDVLLSLIKQDMINEIVPIKGYVDLLLSAKFGNITELQVEKLGLINEQIDKLLSIIADLSVAKLDELKHSYMS